MAQDFSFDAVSEVDLNIVSESIQVAIKEITNRFDFKDANATIELNAKDKKVVVRAKDEYKVEAALDVLFTRLAKRGLPLKNFEKGKVEQALGQTARMDVAVKAGIPTDKAKQMIAAIKDQKLKVNPTIQGEQVRGERKEKEESRQERTLLRSGDFGVEVQFKNFR